MQSFNISGKTLLGKILRLPLKMIPTTMVMPILKGPLQGKKWIVGSGVHGCWLGAYENKKASRFKDSIRPGATVFDIGANVGYYTLLASQQAGSQGKIFAFEPLQENLSFLKSHIELNGLTNVTVCEDALSDNNGIARFDRGPSRSEGKLTSNGQIEVTTRTLDDLIEKEKLPLPDCMKIDVEGAELQVLLGAKALLSRASPIIFLALDNPNDHRHCCELLKALDYKLEPLNGATVESANEIIACKK